MFYSSTMSVPLFHHNVRDVNVWDLLNLNGVFLYAIISFILPTQGTPDKIWQNRRDIPDWMNEWMNEWMNDLFNVEDVGSVYTIFRARGSCYKRSTN